MKSYIFYLYILKCSDSSYYTGVTSNLDKRISEHELGLVKGYTYKRRPVVLEYVEVFNDIRECISREKQIKRWSRKKKEALIQNNYENLHELSRCKNESQSLKSEV